LNYGYFLNVDNPVNRSVSFDQLQFHETLVKVSRWHRWQFYFSI